MRPFNETKRVNSSEGVFVDPEHVNSTVRYSFESIFYDILEPSFEGEFAVGDCNRVVHWNAYGREGLPGMLAKISTAIEVLRRAQNELVKHQVLIDTDIKARATAKAKAKKKRKAKKKDGT